ATNCRAARDAFPSTKKLKTWFRRTSAGRCRPEQSDRQSSKHLGDCVVELHRLELKAEATATEAVGQTARIDAYVAPRASVLIKLDRSGRPNRSSHIHEVACHAMIDAVARAKDREKGRPWVALGWA